MTTLLDLGRADVIGYRIEGNITADDVQTLVDALVSRRQEHGMIRVYAEVGDIETVALGAVVADVSSLLKKLEVLPHIGRTAVVTDAAWLRALAQVEGLVLPFGPVRSYAFTDVEAARSWVVGEPEGVEPITEDDVP